MLRPGNFDTSWPFEKNQGVWVILTGLGNFDTFFGFEKARLREPYCTFLSQAIKYCDFLVVEK